MENIRNPHIRRVLTWNQRPFLKQLVFRRYARNVVDDYFQRCVDANAWLHFRKLNNGGHSKHIWTRVRDAFVRGLVEDIRDERPHHHYEHRHGPPRVEEPDSDDGSLDSQDVRDLAPMDYDDLAFNPRVFDEDEYRDYALDRID